ncbi:PREDICTED: uncharacterized protein LOC104819926 isoform X2 [Tarenaya hassleriana]|uniref:uncharacterized protein LOC104819926 isoform X2 n=1 Tax=Tarenaya hassleriana TaxID=28532 RepID=UPI00053C749E|nr:PREDICTED: uncharacterized protein LOC104819926 isoform X2 [Tarenaya hassleriana]
MRILSARLVKGRMLSLYPSPQSRGSREIRVTETGNRGEVEEILTKRVDAIDEQMREMRQDMRVMKSKLWEISKETQDLMMFKVTCTSRNPTQKHQGKQGDEEDVYKYIVLLPIFYAVPLLMYGRF